MGFLRWLTVLFIGLKLTDLITWSWWWVFGPIWVPVAVLVSFALVLLACGATITQVSASTKKGLTAY